MSDRQLYRKTGNTFRGPVDSAQTIELGDMVFLNTDDIRSMAQFTYGASLAITQVNAAAKFLGVAMNASESGEVRDITIRGTGVFEFDCAAATFEIGDLVALDDNAGGTALLPQQVIACGENGHGAIGRVAKRYSANTTRVEVELLKHRPEPYPVIIPIYEGLITAGADFVTDWTAQYPFKLVAIHTFVTVLTAGALTLSVHKGATALDDTVTIADGSAVGVTGRTAMDDATGDDLFLAGDTLSLVGDGTPTAGQALIAIEIKPMNMQVA